MAGDSRDEGKEGKGGDKELDEGHDNARQQHAPPLDAARVKGKEGACSQEGIGAGNQDEPGRVGVPVDDLATEHHGKAHGGDHGKQEGQAKDEPRVAVHCSAHGDHKEQVESGKGGHGHANVENMLPAIARGVRVAVWGVEPGHLASGRRVVALAHDSIQENAAAAKTQGEQG